jgi:hypothetical protein
MSQVVTDRGYGREAQRGEVLALKVPRDSGTSSALCFTVTPARRRAGLSPRRTASP